MALHFIKDMNHQKAADLEKLEMQIKEKIDDKSTAIGEKYKVHLQNFQKKNNDTYDK